MTKEQKDLMINTILAGMLKPGQRYPGALPAELRDWYVYTLDGGHSIVCVLKQDFEPDADLTNYLIPVPVKTVLRGYEIDGEYIVVDAEYSPVLGLVVPEGDDEY